MPTKLVNGKRIEISFEEEKEIKTNIESKLPQLKHKLVELEKEKALNKLVEIQKALIDGMTEEEVILAIKNGGLD